MGVTPIPNNHPYSSGRGVVKIVQIRHRDVQPGIVQISNQIISRDRHDSNDLSACKIPKMFYHIKVRGLRWPLNGRYVLLLQPCDSSMHHVCRSFVMLKYEWMISVAKYAFYRIKEVIWQCSETIVHISVLIENVQVANTMVANAPTPLVTETIWLLLTMHRHSGIYSPRMFSIHSPYNHNMQCWALIRRKKISRTSCLVLSG